MKPALLLLAISPWMMRVGGDELWRSPPWRYRFEMPVPPSLFEPLNGLPLVRPKTWRPRACCPIKSVA
jgi:hypothetical protein